MRIASATLWRYMLKVVSNLDIDRECVCLYVSKPFLLYIWYVDQLEGCWKPLSIICFYNCYCRYIATAKTNLCIVLSCGLNNQEKLYSYVTLNILSQLWHSSYRGQLRVLESEFKMQRIESVASLIRNYKTWIWGLGSIQKSQISLLYCLFFTFTTWAHFYLVSYANPTAFLD